uniref:Chaperonin-60 alpha 1 fragment (Fragments) n=1 Tax=Brassica napus TaxID=3708 RepID=Q9T2N3_BRANA
AMLQDISILTGAEYQALDMGLLVENTELFETDSVYDSEKEKLEDADERLGADIVQK